MTPVRKPPRDAGAASTPRRILFALDHAWGDPSALEAVATLAARMRAELVGLFVEDIDLLRLAEHGETRILGTISARSEAIDVRIVERVMRVRGEVSRRAIEEAAQRRQVKARFEIRRGRVVDEVLASAAAADLVVVGWSSGGVSVRQGGPSSRPGTIAQAIAEGAARSVLLLKSGVALGGPVLVAYDGSPGSRKALAAAADIADRDGGEVTVVLIADRLDAAAVGAAEVRDALSARGLGCRTLQLPAADLGGLCRAARRVGASLLVMAAELPVIKSETTRRLLERIDCSILLVR